VPIYACASWISLRSRYASDYIDTIRDLYEAFVLYTFFNLCVNFLGGERSLLAALEKSPRTSHMFPISSCFSPMDMSDPSTFLAIRRCIFQFVVVKPILAVITLILKLTHNYQEGWISIQSPYLWIAFLNNISVSLAMYGLVVFFLATRKYLAPLRYVFNPFQLTRKRPLPKFLCVKAIIFFSFWQSFFVAFLVWAGAIKGNQQYSANNIAQALQDFLMCVECVPLAIAHWISFPPSDYDPLYSDFAPRLSGRLPLGYAFRDAIGLKDVVEDAKHVFAGTKFKTVRTYSEVEQMENGEEEEGRWVLGQQRNYRSISQSDDLDATVDFADPRADAETEQLYDLARSLLFGDSNYPVLGGPAPPIRDLERSNRHDGVLFYEPTVHRLLPDRPTK
jgi:hypothetical protein